MHRYRALIAAVVITLCSPDGSFLSVEPLDRAVFGCLPTRIVPLVGPVQSKRNGKNAIPLNYPVAKSPQKQRTYTCNNTAERQKNWQWATFHCCGGQRKDGRAKEVNVKMVQIEKKKDKPAR